MEGRESLFACLFAKEPDKKMLNCTQALMKKLMQKKRNATEGSLGGSKVDVVEEKKNKREKRGRFIDQVGAAEDTTAPTRRNKRPREMVTCSNDCN